MLVNHVCIGNGSSTLKLDNWVAISNYMYICIYISAVELVRYILSDISFFSILFYFFYKYIYIYTLVLSFLAKFILGGLELGKKWGLGCSRIIMLSVMACWCVFNIQGVLHYQFSTFLALFCFNLYKGNFLKFSKIPYIQVKTKEGQKV